MQEGQVIREYALRRKLGEGGMGEVWLATHGLLDQQVAMKFLNPLLAQNAEIRERFVQEAKIQAGLVHPGIVRVLTAVQDQGTLALVMEFVDGLSLDKVLAKRGALPLEDARRVMSQVLDAVGHAHSRGVIHRDLKPSNIMVQADGTAKVMDFGIAKVLGAAKLTRTGTAMGSAHYMSPEQVLGRKDIDHRSDIYSLGCTFFEMLTGHAPFESEAAGDSDSDFLVKQAHVSKPPPDPRALRPELPAAIASALLSALAKAPEARPKDAAVLGQMLLARSPHGSAGAAGVPAQGRWVQVAPAGVIGRATIEEQHGIQFVRIPAGRFRMGSPEGEEGRSRDEGPVHEVTLARPFLLQAAPVTQRQWKALMGNNPSEFSGDDLPVESVSWFDAVAYCNALSRASGLEEAYRLSRVKGTPGAVGFFVGGLSMVVDWKGPDCPGFRLPTEAEWEYACRAGTNGARYGDMERIAWCSDNSGGKTHPVGQKEPNEWGLHDMLGNVWEWVQDAYHDSYEGGPLDGSAWEAPAGSSRVLRGGSWYCGARLVRAAYRGLVAPGCRGYSPGLRPARSP